MSDEDKLGALWAGIGRVKDVEPDARTLLGDLYGRTPRGGVDTAAAAEALGVSRRTIRRWAKEGIPDHAKGNTAREQHRAYRAGPEGRAAAMNPRREARLRKRGTTLSINGKVRISGDERVRKVNVPIDGDGMSDIIDALLAGNDAAAHDALNDVLADFFGGSVNVDVDALETFR